MAPVCLPPPRRVYECPSLEETALAVPGVLELQPDLLPRPPQRFTWGPICCPDGAPGRTMLMSTEALSCGPASGWGVPQSSPISYCVLSQKFPVTPIGEGGVVVGAPDWLSALLAARPLLPRVAAVPLPPGSSVPSPVSLLGPHSSHGPVRWPPSPATGCLSLPDWALARFCPVGGLGVPCRASHPAGLLSPPALGSGPGSRKLVTRLAVTLVKGLGSRVGPSLSRPQPV